jgi:nucleotide-binding universal stress UspA family protein
MMWPIKTILLPTDFSEPSQAALRLASSFAREQGARLVILHVTVVPDAAYEGYGAPGLPLLRDEYLAKEQQGLEKVQPVDPQIKFERRVEEGDPATEILRVASEIGAGLIVMGTHGRGGLQHVLMGSVAEQVVRKAKCPVLTLRTAPVRQPR